MCEYFVSKQQCLQESDILLLSPIPAGYYIAPPFIELKYLSEQVSHHVVCGVPQLRINIRKTCVSIQIVDLRTTIHSYLQELYWHPKSIQKAINKVKTFVKKVI